MRRIKPIKPPEGVENEIRKMLFGTHDEAVRAKQSLILKSVRLRESNPEQAKALKRIYQRIRI